ncbi:AP-5 complex subunit sigma-1-like [Oopsacas minuta]|uniref:AP-5 complex subunit sigma-1-like n=1 Tax=Oopsacas minuta TaxID=111878 RepID=A0AAV7KJQ4_9METZ|nr:AP-5 complex subunit sigma-1-like [Oopsacas minuta]
MVLGFVIAKISSTSWHLIHSTLYPHPSPVSTENSHLGASPITSVDARENRKDSIAEVVRRIQIEFAFQFSANYLASSSKTDESNISVNGTFLLYSNDPFSNQQIVVWRVNSGITYALICDTNENLSLAEYVLEVLIRVILDNMSQEMTAPKILLEADKITGILHVFLPSGTLLFMNHKIVRHLEKELEAILSAK